MWLSSLQSCYLCPEQPRLNFSDSEQFWDKLVIRAEGRKVSVADSAVDFSLCKMAFMIFTNEHWSFRGALYHRLWIEVAAEARSE